LQVLQGQPSIEKFIPIRLMSLWNYEELKLRIPKQLQGTRGKKKSVQGVGKVHGGWFLNVSISIMLCEHTFLGSDKVILG